MYIGIDIGGTHTRIVASKSRENVVFDEFVSHNTEKEYEKGVQQIAATIKVFGGTVDGIGIGIPGYVSEDQVLYGSINLPDWNERPFRVTLMDTFECPVVIRNDAEIAAVGEAHAPGVVHHDFFYLTWGTGLGCAQVVWKDGKAVVDRPEDRTAVHDLEAKIGGNNIRERFGKGGEDLSDSEWEVVLKDLKQDVPPLVRSYGFDTVVIGGGVAVKQKDRLNKAIAEITDIEVRITELEGNAGLYGAIATLRSTS